MLSGDKLIAIDGVTLNIQNYKDLDEAVDMIRGVADTEVTLSFLRNGEPLELQVTRGDVQINYVEYQLIDDIGYVRIYEFESTTAQDFIKALDYFKEQKVSGVIIDLRDNPGGLLSSVVTIADQILPKGRIVYTEDRAGDVSSY